MSEQKNSFCKQHSGHEARIEYLEEGFKGLNKKLDRLILVTLSAFFMGAVNLGVMLARGP